MISFSTEDHINFLNFSDNNRDKNLIKQISIKGYKSMILIKDNIVEIIVPHRKPLAMVSIIVPTN